MNGRYLHTFLRGAAVDSRPFRPKLELSPLTEPGTMP